MLCYMIDLQYSHRIIQTIGFIHDIIAIDMLRTPPPRGGDKELVGDGRLR